jgi:Domain of unknown function (DUF4168)
VNFVKGLLTVGTFMASVTAVAAQEAPAPAPETPAAPEAPAASAGQAGFSTEDIQKFAKAALEIQKLQADTAVAEADKQTRMASIVTENGLDAVKFNEIAQAMQTDPAIQEQVNAAAASAAPAEAPTQ